jgi:hypothetical protein
LFLGGWAQAQGAADRFQRGRVFQVPAGTYLLFYLCVVELLGIFLKSLAKKHFPKNIEKETHFNTKSNAGCSLDFCYHGF